MKNTVPAYKLLQTYNLGCVRIYTSPFFISELLGFCFCIFVIFKCFGSNDFNISERKQNQIKSAAFKIMISFIKGKTMSELTLCQKVTRTTGCASLGIKTCTFTFTPSVSEANTLIQTVFLILGSVRAEVLLGHLRHTLSLSAQQLHPTADQTLILWGAALCAKVQE